MSENEFATEKQINYINILAERLNFSEGELVRHVSEIIVNPAIVAAWTMKAFKFEMLSKKSASQIIEQLKEWDANGFEE